MTLIILFFANARYIHIISIGVVGFIGASLLIFSSTERLSRFSIFNPCQRYLEDGYNLCHSLLAISSGGIFGSGLGAGTSKLLYLFGSHTDFIFAVLAEELGIFGVLLIIILLMNDLFIPSIYGEFKNREANLFSSAYVANDFIGLLVVPNLPRSTKFHHIVTTSLLLYSYTIDFTEENVGRWMFIYTLMSTFTFLVNTYLGLRFIETPKDSMINRLIDNIRILAYYIYLTSCIINWIIHILLTSQKVYNFDLQLSYILYLFLLIPIINDDLILLNWLYNKKKIL